MKTTTKIILGLIAASYLMLVMISTVSLEQPARIFQTCIRGTLKTQKLTAIQAFVALDPYDEDSQNYIIELVSDDNAREITVDYPSELVEVKMKGTMLDIITSSEVGKTKAEGRTFEIVEKKGEEQTSEEGYDTDYSSQTAVIIVNMPKATLLQLLANPKSLNLKGGSLNIANLKADTFDFRRKVELLLDGCNFQRATIDIGTHGLGLVDTHIGQFTFFATEDTINSQSTTISEGKGTAIENLLLRTNTDMNLDYSCYKHINVEQYGQTMVSINFTNVSRKCSLK